MALCQRVQLDELDMKIDWTRDNEEKAGRSGTTSVVMATSTTVLPQPQGTVPLLARMAALARLSRRHGLSLIPAVRPGRQVSPQVRLVLWPPFLTLHRSDSPPLVVVVPVDSLLQANSRTHSSRRSRPHPRSPHHARRRGWGLAPDAVPLSSAAHSRPLRLHPRTPPPPVPSHVPARPSHTFCHVHTHSIRSLGLAAVWNLSDRFHLRCVVKRPNRTHTTCSLHLLSAMLLYPPPSSGTSCSVPMPLCV